MPHSAKRQRGRPRPLRGDASVANNPARKRWRAALLPRPPRMRSREPRQVDPFVSRASSQVSERERRATGGCCPAAHRTSLSVPADWDARRQSRGVSHRQTQALAARSTASALGRVVASRGRYSATDNTVARMRQPSIPVAACRPSSGSFRQRPPRAAVRY